MMVDPSFAILFFILRVFLVGGFLLILPRITRKGLLFGSYVGEELTDGETARHLVSGWRRGCAIVMGVSLFIGLGIGLTIDPVVGNLTGTAVLGFGCVRLYLQYHRKARELVPSTVSTKANLAIAPVLGLRVQGAGLAKLALGICLSVSIVLFVYAMGRHEGVLSDRSFIKMMLFPSVNLMLSPFLALIALLITKAKRSIRGGPGGSSIEAQNTFRTSMSRLTSWTAILSCVHLTFLSVQIIRIEHSETGILGVGFWVLSGGVILALLSYLIRVMRKYGQGGALMEKSTAETPLTDGLADNSRWVLGMFYVGKDDPSIMVESRFGLGYDFNFGNHTAILILMSFALVCLSVVVSVLVETFS